MFNRQESGNIKQQQNPPVLHFMSRKYLKIRKQMILHKLKSWKLLLEQKKQCYY